MFIRYWSYRNGEFGVIFGVLGVFLGVFGGLFVYFLCVLCPSLLRKT